MSGFQPTTALRAQLAGHQGSTWCSPCGGNPFRSASLWEPDNQACIALGFPGYTPHRLRHLAGSALAEAGCSVHEIMSILGHRSERQAIEYVGQANAKRMAASAMAKWNASGTRTD